MSNSADEWVKRLAADAEGSPKHQRLHAAAVEFLGALRAFPPSGYRDKAECAFGDAIVLTFVAARP